MHIDRRALHAPAQSTSISTEALQAQILTTARRPEFPAVPGCLQRVLEPQETSLRFTETSYYAVERWQPREMTIEEERAARAYLRRLDEAMVPADKDRLLIRVLALLSHYRSDPNPPEVEYVMAEGWAEDLGEFPSWVIDEAAREWRRTRKFKPQICEIRAACMRIAKRELTLQERLRRLLESHEAKQNPRQNRQQQKVTAVASGLAAALAMAR